MTHRDNAMPEFLKVLDSFSDLKGKYVLEIGQGGDRQFREVFESRGMHYYGADSKSVPEGDRYVLAYMEDLSIIQSDFFDVVFSCHAFEHCERPVNALREMFRVLKPGGRVLLITPNPCEHHILNADYDHIMVLYPMQMERLLRYTGFYDITSYVQNPPELKEQDWNVFTIGVKK